MADGFGEDRVWGDEWRGREARRKRRESGQRVWKEWKRKTSRCASKSVCVCVETYNCILAFLIYCKIETIKV